MDGVPLQPLWRSKGKHCGRNCHTSLHAHSFIHQHVLSRHLQSMPIRLTHKPTCTGIHFRLSSPSIPRWHRLRPKPQPGRPKLRIRAIGWRKARERCFCDAAGRSEKQGRKMGRPWVVGGQRSPIIVTVIVVGSPWHQRVELLPERTVVRLPANYEALYRRAVAELETHLLNTASTTSRESIRALIEKIVVHAGDSRGGKVRRLDLYGDLFRMLEFAHASTSSGVPAKRSKSGVLRAVEESGTPVVAGAGFEPATFRL